MNRSASRHKGKLTQWHDDKGYGFITPFSADKRVFVHISAFEYRKRRPLTGDVLTYSLSIDQQGRPNAQAVSIAGMQTPERGLTLGSFTAYAIAGVFMLFLGLVVVSGHLPVPVMIYYWVLGAMTYLAYYFDKSAARAGHWRTRESTLHFLSLIGGWPGALIAQTAFRHKTRKQPFRAIFWSTVMMNGLLLTGLLTEQGKGFVESLL
ncbi:MAG: cold shock and DUF1294 domain-containing protein [Candidatus Thiodiazotropha sp.]